MSGNPWRSSTSKSTLWMWGGVGGFGIMVGPGNIAISGADGSPLPRGR